MTERSDGIESVLAALPQVVTRAPGGLIYEPEAVPEEAPEAQVTIAPEPEAEIEEAKGLGPPPQTLEAALALISVQKRKPRKLNEKETLVALQYKWRQAFSNGDMPTTLEALERVIPSGLNRSERKQYLEGAFEGAKMAFIRVLNTSWTKTELWERAAAAGLAHTLPALKPDLRNKLLEVVKYITD